VWLEFGNEKTLPKTSVCLLLAYLILPLNNACRANENASEQDRIIVKPDLFKSLTEPPCLYCSTQHCKGLIEGNDRVIAWIRGAYNGGAVSLRHFLAGPRVVNDTYGLFFYDPDGGYVAGYKKDYGYRFYGWRNGVMIVKGPDGYVWSTLSGVCIKGPKKGEHVTRVPSLVTIGITG